MIAMTRAVSADNPAPPLSVALRNVGYTSWVPWLIQLNAVMSRMRNTKRRTIDGFANTFATDTWLDTLRSRAASQTSDSCTRLRTIRLISAGSTENANR